MPASSGRDVVESGGRVEVVVPSDLGAVRSYVAVVVVIMWFVVYCWIRKKY